MEILILGYIWTFSIWVIPFILAIFHNYIPITYLSPFSAFLKIFARVAIRVFWDIC